MTLATIQGPHDLRSLSPAELRHLAKEIRGLLIDTVARTGGHLGPNLGVVELTIALHRVFESPRDLILWDTGHQTYVHKLLTGRAGQFGRLRQSGGLSGYPSRAESPHDHMENSHASTALSVADGLTRAHRLLTARSAAHGVQPGAAMGMAGQGSVVAVVGDGALTGGMAWEALNNLGGAADRSVIIVLNDNGRSYAPTAGGLARHLADLRSGKARGCVFEDMGLTYLGPVEGHDLTALQAALLEAKQLGGPVVVHTITSKGAGYDLAENHDLDRFHAVKPMNPLTGCPTNPEPETWTDVFSAAIVRLARQRPNVITLTAAMLEPTGLRQFAETYPDRIFDVGIAEQHAVGAAAGLAMAGLHPVVAVYATFLNRAYDQVLMDVAMHGLPVTFVLDRAGITGDDGASHNGVWDLSILQTVPGLRIAAPRDSARLRGLLAEALDVTDGPTVLRFPKGPASPDLPALHSHGPLDILHAAAPGDNRVLIVAIGAMAQPCLTAADLLESQGFSVTVVDPRWVKPLDPSLVELASAHALVTVVEDGSRTGGVGDAVARLLREGRTTTPVTALGVPLRFLQHGKRSEILDECGLSPQAIARAVVGAAASQAPHWQTPAAPRTLPPAVRTSPFQRPARLSTASPHSS